MDGTKLLTDQQVAEEYGLNVNTLRDWRWRNRVLPYVKFGNAVRYRRADIEAYLDEHTVEPTGR